MALVAAGALPFVIWDLRTHSIWPEFSIGIYLLTAGLVFTLLIGYPGSQCDWFRRLVTIMVLVHIALVSTFVAAAFGIVAAGVRPPVAMFFGVVIAAMAVESWIALRLISKFLAKADRHS
jgi:hypothetical protein